MKRLPSRFRFPMFFTGVMIVIIAGFLDKFAVIGAIETEAAVAAGFIILVLSIAA